MLLALADTNLRALVKAMLQSQSIECETPADGRAALEMIRNTPPDAAVLDADLPDCAGCGISEALRAANPGARILFLKEQDSAAQAADDCLAKPFDPVALVVRLNRMLKS